MSPEPTAKGETPETAAQVAPVVVTPEPEVEKYDEPRAMALIAKLREESKNAKKDAKRLAELEAANQSRVDAEKTELQKAQDHAAQLEAALKTERLRIMRRDAAEKTKLPAVFADRLQGETPEELEADALKILASIPAAVPPKLDATNPGRPQTGETEAEKRKRLIG
jgi:hypothetical protein